MTQPTEQDIETWFTFHPPKEGQAERYERLRAEGKRLARIIMETCPEGADRTMAIRTLRGAIHWAIASIACGE